MKLKFSGGRALIIGGSCEIAIFLAECMIKAKLFPILTYRNEKGLKNISEKLRIGFPRLCRRSFTRFHVPPDQ